MKKVLLLLFVIKCHSLVGFKFESFDNIVFTRFVIYHMLETNVKCNFFLNERCILPKYLFEPYRYFMYAVVHRTCQTVVLMWAKHIPIKCFKLIRQNAHYILKLSCLSFCFFFLYHIIVARNKSLVCRQNITVTLHFCTFSLRKLMCS